MAITDSATALATAMAVVLEAEVAVPTSSATVMLVVAGQDLATKTAWDLGMGPAISTVRLLGSRI